MKILIDVPTVHARSLRRDTLRAVGELLSVMEHSRPEEPMKQSGRLRDEEGRVVADYALDFTS